MEHTRTSQIDNTTIILGDKEFLIHKKFDSKKNQVFLVSDSFEVSSNYVVLKIYNDEFKKNAKIESNTIKKLNQLDVSSPKIIDHSTDWILLEYIPGLSILQIVDSDRIDIEPDRLITLLADWLAQLHSKTLVLDPEPQVLLKGDCILKNFIYDNDLHQLYGVDFEESVIGEPLRDVGAVCSAILTIKPMFSSSDFNLCEAFIKSYMSHFEDLIIKKSINSKIVLEHITPESIIDSTSSALEFAASWMSKENSELALNWSKKIKDKRSFNLL
jgi:aminoglycoside phosphotransferase